MENSHSPISKLLESNYLQPRYAPAFFALLFLIVLGIFSCGMESETRNYLFRHITIYGIGAACIGTFHRLIGFKFGTGENSPEKKIPWPWIVAIWILHFGWMVLIFSKEIFQLKS